MASFPHNPLAYKHDIASVFRTDCKISLNGIDDCFSKHFVTGHTEAFLHEDTQHHVRL